MSETLVSFDEPIRSDDGILYDASVLGECGTDALWHGAISFLPRLGGPAILSERETTQPNRDLLMYWATGLSRVYLQGALTRAIDRHHRERVQSAWDAARAELPDDIPPPPVK